MQPTTSTPMHPTEMRARELRPLTIVCVIFVCVLGLALILSIPAESLAVDLVYQGF
jgi:hypothetical protein